MSLTLIGIFAILLIGVAITAFSAAQFATAGGLLKHSWARYEARLQRDLRFLFSRTTGARVARIQAGVVAALVFLAFLPKMHGFALLVPIAVIAPVMYSSWLCEVRRVQMDTQLPLWLLALANALKASPSIGEALISSTPLIPKPIQDELELTLKEIQLGAAVDQALRNMRERINTRNFSAAVSTVLVARDTGGDLPRILEDSSAALREMDRLEGVLRTRTAEGKAQAYLMGIMPFVLVAVLHWIDPLWLPQLTRSVVGYAIIGVATCLWLVAIFVARKVLAVNL